MSTEPAKRLEAQAARRKRASGFPLLGLDEAAAVLAEAIKYGTEHHLTAFAGYMGHGSTNSGAFRSKLAAFRDWGLVTRAVDDRVSITDLGRRIALPVDEDQRSRDLIDAFKSSDVFAAVYEQAAKGSALRLEVIARMAVHSQGVSPRLQEQFGRSFLRSAVVAGLAEDLGDGTLRLRPEPSAANSAPSLPREVSETPAAPAPARLASLDAGTPPTSHRATWPFGIGEVVLEVRSKSPLPPSAYRNLADVADAIVGLVEVLREGADHDDGAVGRSDVTMEVEIAQ